ncbi:MAG: hypothetical protein J6R47_04420 [Acholeplasmatales bacterium]|nr:hypothetical protein [Acholeplasmatales bacterium]
MNLKNGYKVMYEVIEGSERVFSASKTGLFADAEEIARFEIGSYKVVYQRGEEFFGIDAEGVETRLDAFDAIFVEATEVEEEVKEPVAPVVEPEIPAEPEKTEEPEVGIPEEGTAEE